MGEPKGSNGKGQERLKRYTALIDDSKQLKSLKTYAGSVYYQEPFYQLMRQTLWAEQMIKNYDSEAVKADDFLHMHVIPQENYELLGRPYHLSGKPMEETWRSLLNDNAKYVIVSPERLLSPVYERYPELISYLKTRYW